MSQSRDCIQHQWCAPDESIAWDTVITRCVTVLRRQYKMTNVVQVISICTISMQDTLSTINFDFLRAPTEAWISFRSFPKNHYRQRTTWPCIHSHPLVRYSCGPLAPISPRPVWPVNDLQTETVSITGSIFISKRTAVSAGSEAEMRDVRGSKPSFLRHNKVWCRR